MVTQQYTWCTRSVSFTWPWPCGLTPGTYLVLPVQERQELQDVDRCPTDDEHRQQHHQHPHHLPMSEKVLLSRLHDCTKDSMFSPVSHSSRPLQNFNLCASCHHLMIFYTVSIIITTSLHDYVLLLQIRWVRGVWVLCWVFSSVQFSLVPWPIGSKGGYEERISRAPLPVFSAGGPCQQFCHGQGCPLFDVVHPAFPRRPRRCPPSKVP